MDPLLASLYSTGEEIFNSRSNCLHLDYLPTVFNLLFKLYVINARLIITNTSTMKRITSDIHTIADVDSSLLSADTVIEIG